MGHLVGKDVFRSLGQKIDRSKLVALEPADGVEWVMGFFTAGR